MIDDDVVVFFLDVKSHLLARIETVRRIPSNGPRPGVVGSGNSSTSSSSKQYTDVAGVQVPSQIVRGRDRSHVCVEITPDYDRAIFTTPRSPDAGPESWRRAR
jgi:hypothetical protein